MTTALCAIRHTFTITIAALIEGCGLTQKRIAHALGYENSNMITMFKTGRTRMPPEKVVPFANVVGHDPKILLRHWFAAYMSEVLPDVDRYLASPHSEIEVSGGTVRNTVCTLPIACHTTADKQASGLDIF